MVKFLIQSFISMLIFNIFISEYKLIRPWTSDCANDFILFQEAKEVLVEAYAQLRQRDNRTSGGLSWRITVRQLESLVRLSEAMAKMECSDDVTVRHVEEAKKLLNKSLLRVEQPDVLLDREEDEMDVDEPAEMPSTPAPAGLYSFILFVSKYLT